MKKMIIFDPAMCCPTGLCGPSINSELLRISTVINNLNSKGILVERYNLANDPQMFIDNEIINEILMTKGDSVLPITMVDNKIVKVSSYPTNDEICALLEISSKLLNGSEKKSNNYACKDGGC